MTREGKKAITDESYNKSGFFTLVPNGIITGAVRYPAFPLTFPKVADFDGPVDYFLVRNMSGTDLRVAVDSDASASFGHLIHQSEILKLPRRGMSYISLYGGDGTDIEIHWFSW